MSYPYNLTGGPIAAAQQAVGLEVLGMAALSVQVTRTWVGTLVVEVSDDNATWQAVFATPVAGGASVATITGNGSWRADVAAFRYAQVRASAWTSGTATVALAASPAGAGATAGAISVVRNKATPTESAVSGSGSGTLVVAGARQSVRATLVSGSAWVSRATPAAAAAPSRLMGVGDYLYDDETTAAWYYTAVGGTATFSVEVVA